MTDLYIEPMLYVPYRLNLKNKHSIRLKELTINGEQVAQIDLFKPRRMPNQDYVYFEATRPISIDVKEFIGTKRLVEITLSFELTHDDKVIKVSHRHHVGFAKQSSDDSTLCHYSLRAACPTAYGMEGKKLMDERVGQGSSKSREILQFGLHGADHDYKKWIVESMDVLHPTERKRNTKLH